MLKTLPTPVAGLASIRNPNVEGLMLSRPPLRTGMEYFMLYDHRKMAAPNVPPPVRRASLAQQQLIHRYQISKYISRLRNFGLRPDHPAFHGFKITVQGRIATTPVMSDPQWNTPRPLAGSMRAPARFAKALPTAPNPYIAPTYGG